MKTGMEIIKEYADEAGITLGETIDGSVFNQLGLPMIVSCKCCESTMTLPSAIIDDEGYTYCTDCISLDDQDITGEIFNEYGVDYEDDIDESMNPYDGTYEWQSEGEDYD